MSSQRSGVGAESSSHWDWSNDHIWPGGHSAHASSSTSKANPPTVKVASEFAMTSELRGLNASCSDS